MPYIVRSKKDFASVEEMFENIIGELRSRSVDYIVLAGYLCMISENFVRAFPDRIINIHPSLIPSFCGKGYYGLNVHRAAIEYGVKVSGCTVHFVDEHYDSGAILLQRTVPVFDDDTPERLQARVLEEEHRALPEAVRLLVNGAVEKTGRKVVIRRETE